MNNPNSGSSHPFSSRDRHRLVAPAHRQNFEAGLSSSLSALRAPATDMGSSPSPNLLAGFYLPESRLLPFTMSTLSHMAPLGASGAGLVAPAQPKFDAIAQQHMQNASILRSSMDQKLQLINYEDQMRARLMLLPSSPLLQAHLMNDSRFFMGGMGMPGFSPGHLRTPNKVNFKNDQGRVMRGGVIEPFPEKLHRLLLEVEAAGKADIISFIAHGRAFAIHKPDKFCNDIVPKYFRQSRFNSFKRQLNLYGFILINSGPHRGGYYHKSFIKNRPDLCREMRRVAVKVPVSNQETLPDVESRPTSSHSRHDGKPTSLNLKEDQQGKEQET